MLLEAHSIGLGGVWLGEILKSRKQVEEILAMKKGLELMAVIALGVPAENPKSGKRKELKDLIVFRK